jgi:hypothetical protein
MGNLPALGSIAPGESKTIRVLPGSVQLTARDGAVAIALPGLGTLPQTVGADALASVTVDGQRPGPGTFELTLGSQHTILLCAGGR